MKKLLVVIAQKDFRDEELFEPLEEFDKNNIKYDIVSNEKGEHIGMLGAKVNTDLTINDINNINDYDGIVIVGGTGSKEYLWNNEKLLNLVKLFNKEGKVVSAICISPAVLANAEVLNNKKATVYPSEDAIEQLKKGGISELLEDGVVCDGNIITGKSPEFAKKFGEEIVKLLNK